MGSGQSKHLFPSPSQDHQIRALLIIEHIASMGQAYWHIAKGCENHYVASRLKRVIDREKSTPASSFLPRAEVVRHFRGQKTAKEQ
jgi:hypothetical protein